MLIEGNSHLKLSVSSLPTKSNILEISSSWEATTNAHQSIEFMASMMNVTHFHIQAKEGTTSNFGRSSPIASIACPLQPWSMIEFYACMAGYHLISNPLNKLKKFKNQLMFPIMDSSVIYSGVIPTKIPKRGAKMKGEYHIHLVLIMLICSAKNTILISYVELIKWWKRGTSSLPRGN